MSGGRAGATRLAGLLAGLALAASAGGCGGGTSDEDAVRSAVGQLQDAFDAGRLETVCAGMTPAARRYVIEAGHGSQPNCPEAMKLYRQWVADGRSKPLGDAERKTTVEMTGSGTAHARIVVGSGAPAQVRLVERDGEWRLDSLFGIDPRLSRKVE